MSEKKDRTKGNGGDGWRDHARSLGVDPDEPDDYRYWSALTRAESLVDSFKYHQPSDAQIGRISNVRKAHIELTKQILCNVQSSADQTVALRKVHESMMTCNKAIVNEQVEP